MGLKKRKQVELLVEEELRGWGAGVCWEGGWCCWSSEEDSMRGLQENHDGTPFLMSHRQESDGR